MEANETTTAVHDTHFHLKMWDARRLLSLPPDWVSQIHALAEEQSKQCSLDGRSSTSREPEGIVPINVSIVTGEIIQRELPWLYDAYRHSLRTLAQQLVRREITTSHDLRNSININIVTGIGGRYERHVDTNPVTGILYPDTLHVQDGGALVFDHEVEGETVSDCIYPRKGLFIAFDARNTPHSVAPLLRPVTRISVPMNYYIAGEHQDRPAGLDDYLYSQV